MMSDKIEQFIEESGADPMIDPMMDAAPMYRIDAASKVPVSRKMGALWESRIKAALKGRKLHTDSWDECLQYFNNNQMGHRNGGKDNASGNRYFATRRNGVWSETENLVYSNVSVALPALYAKNPTVEFTAFSDKYKPAVQTLESLTNALAMMHVQPGLNLKPHAEMGVLTAEITNLAWMEYGYTLREKSATAAQSDLEKISSQLAEAKDQKEIQELEGQLMALEEEIDILNPPGPFVRIHPPHNVIADADAAMPDFSDAKWIGVRECYPTSYLNARYGEKDENGKWKSIYEPTAVINASDTGTSNEMNQSLFDEGSSFKSYGYDSEDEYRKAQRTHCWRIWDKVTRRVYLFAENNYKWPIWVENDPYNLPNFTPLEPLSFNSTPGSAYARSNVTYYLDQQDGINEIHDEYRRARKDAKDNILFNDKLDKTAVETWLRGSDSPVAQGVSIPDGTSFKDMILEKPNAVAKNQMLFDPQRLYQSMDRVSGITDTMRGVQFKTNTTNKAIESYNSSTATRLDKKIDAIESWLGKVLYGVAFLSGQFMSSEQMIEIIGEERTGEWQPMSFSDLRKMFSVSTVGGSTQKMTSDAKKQTAMEQVSLLAKIADKAPVTSITIMLNILNEAFDDFEIPPNTFDQLQQEITTAMQRGNSNPGAGGGDPTQAGGPQGQPGIQELMMAVDSLPPAAKMALGQALAQGIPVAEALPEVLRSVQQSGSNMTEGA